jgi:hypothetical protein
VCSPSVGACLGRVLRSLPRWERRSEAAGSWIAVWQTPLFADHDAGGAP